MFSNTSKKLIAIISAIFFIALGVGYMLNYEPLAVYLSGLALGTVTAVVKVLVAELGVSKALLMEPGRSQLYIQGNFIIRYGLTAAALVVAAITPGVSLVGAVIGVLSMQIAGYIVGFADKQKNRKNNRRE